MQSISSQELNGILIVDKPAGMTSHDVVYRVRRITGQRHLGHAGTLDPLATGVLVLCLGRATRLIEYLIADDKVYHAQLGLGVTTSTYDAEGAVVRTQPVNVTRRDLTRVLCGLLGRQEQIPPMYSAIKQGGVPLYKKARRGETVERQAREIDIAAIEVLRFAPPEVELRVHCSKGTYVRTLAHDIGERLGCGAHLAALRREASGAFRIEEAFSLEAISAEFAAGRGPQLLRAADTALHRVPAITVSEDVAQEAAFGRRVRLPAVPAKVDLVRLYSEAGTFIGVLTRESVDLWHPHKVMVTP